MDDLQKLVERWAKEAGVDWVARSRIEDFARLAMAHAAEEAAKVCDAFRDGALKAQSGASDDLSNVMLRQVAELGHGECARAIRERFKNL